jgi:FtsH-binding integral membrane protein
MSVMREDSDTVSVKSSAMSEDRENMARVYKRAAIGLAIAAISWTGALLFGGVSEADQIHWLIPIAAAVLSVVCFSFSAKK